MANFTRVPKPPTPIRHLSSWRPKPEPIQLPQDLPSGFPNGLKLMTWDTIGAATKLFPQKSQVLELCKRVLVKLTPAFCAEVRAARLRADLALSLMSELLRSLLVYNVSSNDEGYRHEQALRRTKEWDRFIRRLKREEKHLGSQPSFPAALTPHTGSQAGDGMSLHDELSSFRAKILKCEGQIEFWTGIKEKSASASPGYRQACAQLPRLRTARAELVRAMESHQSQKGRKESSSSARWFDSHPDVLRRRQIVLTNPNLSALDLCRRFDLENIPLVSGWENELNKPTWVEAYKKEMLRARIQRITSTDRKKK